MAFGFDIGKREELVLEGLSGGFGVEVYLVLGTLVLDDDGDGSHGENALKETVKWRAK